jgi:hypothetical protein
LESITTKRCLKGGSLVSGLPAVEVSEDSPDPELADSLSVLVVVVVALGVELAVVAGASGVDSGSLEGACSLEVGVSLDWEGFAAAGADATRSFSCERVEAASASWTLDRAALPRSTPKPRNVSTARAHMPGEGIGRTGSVSRRREGAFGTGAAGVSSAGSGPAPSRARTMRSCS